MPEAVTEKVVLPPSQIVAFCGLAETAGSELTVKVAVLDVPGVVQLAFDNIQRYWYPLMPVVTPVRFRVAAFAPEYIPPLVMSLNPLPVFTCH